MSTRAERRQMTANRIKAMSYQPRAEAFRLFRDKGPISTKEVAGELDVDVQELSYHVRNLKELNCIEVVSRRRVRNTVETFYRATEVHAIDIEEWAELAEDEPEMAEYSVDEFMQSIVDDYTASRRASIVGRDDEFWVVRNLLALDPKGLREAEKASERYDNAMLSIAARSASRHVIESLLGTIPRREAHEFLARRPLGNRTRGSTWVFSTTHKLCLANLGVLHACRSTARDTKGSSWARSNRQRNETRPCMTSWFRD